MTRTAIMNGSESAERAFRITEIKEMVNPVKRRGFHGLDLLLTFDRSAEIPYFVSICKRRWPLVSGKQQQIVKHN